LATIPEMHLAADRLIDRSLVAVIVPTCNAEKHWAALCGGLRRQGIPAGQVLIVDSSSDDRTAELAQREGYRLHRIERKDFNHGGTRQLALGLVPWASLVIYLTQDAVLATPDSLDLLLSAFEDSRVAAAYGRQLPRPGAGPIEAHARLFNYPPHSEVRDYESRHTLGIKAAFLSNSFSAYRIRELQDVGGFPSDVIMAEDAIVAGRLLLAGWKTAYVAEAQVYHSHPFTISQEFQRYFDIGVCHRCQVWLLERFGDAESEGGRYVRSELSYLARRSPHLLPIALLRTVTKALGYNLGLHGRQVNREWSRRLSYHKHFWDEGPTAPKDAKASLAESKLASMGRLPFR